MIIKKYNEYLVVSDLEGKVFDLGNPWQDKWNDCIRRTYDEAGCDGWQEVATKRPDVMHLAYLKAVKFIKDNKI